MASGYNPRGAAEAKPSRKQCGRGRDKRRLSKGQRGVKFSLKSLEELSKTEPDNIVLDLGSDRCLPAFRELLGRTDMKDEMIELVVNVLARACDSNSPEYFNKLLLELPKSLFVILVLKGFISRLYGRLQSNYNFQPFIERTVKLFTEILKKIPRAFESLPLGDLEQVVDILATTKKISPEVIQSLEQLKVIKKESLEIDMRKREIENNQKTQRRKPDVEPIGPPPDNFRKMRIIPHRDDIFTEKKPYLRKNIVQGGYENLEHYLDVQFRLLREDFLRPLREGIINLVNQGIDQQHGLFKDIRIYRNVKVLYPVCSSSGLRHHIQFDNSKLKHVKWENSKRLIFGSLLCLSKDNFQTFVFATVADRDPKEITSGKLTVQFMDLTIDVQDFSRKNVYEMVETTAYFEAYNPILEGLQQTEDNDLPFQSYLIECNKDIQAPQYLRRNRHELAAPSFDFSSIVVDNTTISETGSLHERFCNLSFKDSDATLEASQFKDVPVLEEDRWPNKEQLGLDESQYEALKIALTKEVAVIQGPPGTGKTFIGLKIAKLLLNNTETWIHGERVLLERPRFRRYRHRYRHREVTQTPILVICYTNHALDQFLEGIYDFYGHNEDKIVRIGGRSKSEKLQECNLKAIKEKYKKLTPRFMGREIGRVHAQLRDVKKNMEISSNAIKKCWQDILYEATLKKSGVVQQHLFLSLMRPFTIFGGGQPEKGSVILQWLNLVAGDEWTEEEELVIIGEDNEILFSGMQMERRQPLPLANVDFSLSVDIKTDQGGSIVSNLPGDLRWNDESKALYIDNTGVVKFISGKHLVCDSISRINDDQWHEIAVVYSNEYKSLTLFIDKRIENRLYYDLPEEGQMFQIVIGVAPLYSGHGFINFSGSMKKFVYYRSTKYEDEVWGDGNVEYEINFMQDQRRIDDGDDIFDDESGQVADNFDVVDPSKFVQGSGQWQVQNKKRAKSKMMSKIRKRLQKEDIMTDQEEVKIRDVWELPLNDRWRLYRKWVRHICQQHQNTIANVQEEYNDGMKELQELYNAKNYELLRKAHVIGMTTTGAAKHRKLLHRIKPKITIVEEAAEVLESHIVTALTGGCEHLILIGDHKQLRPKPTVFQLGLDYKLDISLFERMVDNEMPFACLQAQHRMRPEISVMMRPIYNNLTDHESVLNFERIKGINKNIFFVDHQVNEDPVDENRSHSNIHEAKFIGGLCQYLLQQGYSPSEITVLTPYSGQLFHLKKFVPSKEGLRVCVVDNFQGEENEIILLSLVRSQEITTNEKREIRKLIGFLAIDNRICVSLSRARKGFFCIGNLTLMRAANDLWSQILDEMDQMGCVGESLSLACQNHPKTITRVSNLSDFKRAPNGGCSVDCGARLDCGHRCEQLCHPTDPNHLEYKCRKPCTKKCKRGHPCIDRCFRECSDCMVKIPKTIPQCNHVLDVPCHQDPSTFPCSKPCLRKLRCGHPCTKTCGEPCTPRCMEEVLKTWSPCDHTCKTQCHVDPRKTACPQPCNSLLDCEHTCEGTCGGCKQGRVHQACSHSCGRVLFCNHQCKVPCTKNCPPCGEKCENSCPHSTCQLKCGRPCMECKEPCQWKCEHLKCTNLCGEMCNRPRCNKPCRKRLKNCGHRCAGLCGEPCPRKCLVCDKDELTEIFFGYEDEKRARFIELADCGHVLEVKGMDGYIDTQEKEMKNGQSTCIKMIKCPKCQKAIRKSLRYGNIVKAILRDFEEVKKNIYIRSRGSTSTSREKVREAIASINSESEFSSEISKIEEKLQKSMTNEEENVIENQVQFLKFMTKLTKIIKQAESSTDDHEAKLMQDELNALLQWVMKPNRRRFSEQELEEFNEELHRAHLMFSYLALSLEIRKRKVNLSSREGRYMAYVREKIETGSKLNEQSKENCSSYLKYITSNNEALSVKYTTVTEEEKKILVKAMGLTQGHWFKCPKGHIYCIGECGGAMEEAKCPECGSTIGGTQHRLVSDNSLASEMDGARHAAWSDTANNMAN